MTENFDNNVSGKSDLESDGLAPDETGKDEVVETGPEPNIVFVGEGEPTTKINDGMSTYKLPKVADQADVEETEKGKTYKGKPFYHKNAGNIVQLFPDMYKHFVKKGS